MKNREYMDRWIFPPNKEEGGVLKCGVSHDQGHAIVKWRRYEILIGELVF